MGVEENNFCVHYSVSVKIICTEEKQKQFALSSNGGDVYCTSSTMCLICEILLYKTSVFSGEPNLRRTRITSIFSFPELSFQRKPLTSNKDTVIYKTESGAMSNEDTVIYKTESGAILGWKYLRISCCCQFFQRSNCCYTAFTEAHVTLKIRVLIHFV